jgi:hypothetical protein
VVDEAIDVSQSALRACTGSVEMSVFQMLSAGKTWQLVVGGAAAAAGTSVARPATNRAVTRKAVRANLVPIPLE